MYLLIDKPLFSTNVRTCTHAYMSFCPQTRVFGVVCCMNLHSTVYQNTIPEASSTMRALSGARRTDARLYTLRIKIGTRTTSRPLAGYGLPPPPQGEFCRPYFS